MDNPQLMSGAPMLRDATSLDGMRSVAAPKTERNRNDGMAEPKLSIATSAVAQADADRGRHFILIVLLSRFETN